MPRPVQDPRDRFWSKVEKTDTCWVWMAGKSHGYGRFRLGTFTWQAHKLAWEWEHGPVPPGQELDHLCRNRACVRPSHLELVTHQVNAARQVPDNGRRRKTHCVHGHPFDASNTILRRTRTGWGRQCRACHRKSTREAASRRRKGILAHVPKGTWVGMDGPWLRARARNEERLDR